MSWKASHAYWFNLDNDQEEVHLYEDTLHHEHYLEIINKEGEEYTISIPKRFVPILKLAIKDMKS